jgi:hypothetical protein
MDIVERLRLIIKGDDGPDWHHKNPDVLRNPDGPEAADEILQMREDMVEIMWLLTRGPDRTRDIMAIINPWIIKQVAYIDARAALKEGK